MTLPRGVDQKIFQPPSFIAELDQFLPVTTGSSQIATKRVQEYLTLRGFRLSIDGDFGPATVNQLKSFQRSASLPDTGYYDVLEHNILSKPFLNALRAPDNSSLDFGATVVDIARQHIIECPKEVGGQNSGPWVRLYMDGHDGAPYLWCAGFCFFILSQSPSDNSGCATYAT